MIKHVQDNINRKREERNIYRENQEEKAKPIEKIIYDDTIIETPIFKRKYRDEDSRNNGGSLGSRIILLAVVAFCINSSIKNVQFTQILNNYDQEKDSKANSQIEKISKIGRAELEKTDGKKYSNGVDEAWCADFVTWIKNQAGVSNDVIPNFSSCYYGAQFFKDKGRWHDRGKYTPNVGDLVFFSWNTQSISYDHVGWIDEVYKEENETKIKVINGNPKVVISIYNINDSRIIGYGSPDYSKDIVFNAEINTQKTNGELSLNFIQKKYSYKYKDSYDEKEI